MKRKYTGKPCICGNVNRVIEDVKIEGNRTKITVVCYKCGAVEMRGWADEQSKAESNT